MYKNNKSTLEQASAVKFEMTVQTKTTHEEVSCGSSVCCDGLPPLSPKIPWLFVQNQEDDKDDQIFYNLYGPLSKYQCRIPELVGKRIRGCFHGWLILTNYPHNNLWSLWNPSSTSDVISLPPLILKDGNYEFIRECCLSAPPNDPNSVLLLTLYKKPTFVFCPLTCKRNKKPRNKPRWTEMSYAHQLKRITGQDGLVLISLTCCNGKVFALTDHSLGYFLIWVDIVLKDREALIKLSLFGVCPFPSINTTYSNWIVSLKGSGTELFYIMVVFDVETTDIETLVGVYPYKLDMTSITCEEMERFKGLDMTGVDWREFEEEDLQDMEKSIEMWEQMLDLKEATFFVDLALNHLVFYRSPVATELGGYIHIREGKVIYSYHVKNNTISLSSMPSLVVPTSSVSLWECRLEDDHGEAKCTGYFKPKEDEVVVRSVTNHEVALNESRLLSIPVDVLKRIMECCVGVEYMNFRTICKPCHLAAPLIQWNKETSLKKLQTYSLVSPWLMVIDEIRGILTFTDPILGDKCYMKNSNVAVFNGRIYCSRFGWLLFWSNNFKCLVFFNPFTNDLRKLPITDYDFRSACFSAPPTSPDCKVFGFTNEEELSVLVHAVNKEPRWHIVHLGVGPYSLQFPTFVGQYIYALCNKGELIVFKDLDQEQYSCEIVEAGSPRICCPYPAQYFLMNCDQHLLLVSVSKFGEHVEIFKRYDSTEEWEKIDCLGKHMIFICGTTCLCIEAKTPEMENKIYFPRLHSENKQIVFYSLETSRYHTFYGKTTDNNFEDFLGTTHHLSHPIWIEPSWS